MRIHVLQHESFEGPGSIASWAARRGDTVTSTHFYRDGWQLPSPSEVDMLVVMGGPMSIHDEDKHAWLVDEKRFLKNCIGEGKKIVGVCLGSQLLAQVLGAKVYKNNQKEIGWHPIYKNQPHAFTEHWPKEGMAFHWHGETFDLPEGAVHLASSHACPHQAFIWNDQVFGLQCHLEVEAANVEGFISNCAGELDEKGDYIQTGDKMRSGLEHCTTVITQLDRTLDLLAA